MDDRSEGERGLAPLKEGEYRIPKSRYDSVSRYIANDPRNKDEYSDIDAPINEKVRQRLLDEGLDDKLASHLGHLYIRDPLVQFSETIDQDDESSMDHFENIQSTNWQTIRFKPPPVNSDIGWRVEFRPMEIQMTDFENAAFSIFIVLLTRAIISFNLNFYMPISQVDENIQRAQQRNAAQANKFFFRRAVFPHDLSTYDLESRPVSPPNIPTPDSAETPMAAVDMNQIADSFAKHNGIRKQSSFSSCASLLEDETGPDVVEMTIDEVINGHDDFPGLMGVVNAYLNSINTDVATKCELRRYLDLIKMRAKGDLVTPATWIRNFITSHSEYKQDSVVSDDIQYDLVKAVDEL